MVSCVFFVFAIILKMPVEVTPDFALSVSVFYNKSMSTVSTGISKSTSFPVSLSSHQSCFRCDAIINPKSGFIQGFKTEKIDQCWHYCKLTTDCKLFSFHVISRNCSLFSRDKLTTQQGFFIFCEVVVAKMSCLECLGGAVKIIEWSQAGVLIEMPKSGKCLAVSKTKVNGSGDGREGFELTSVSCPQGNLWEINQNDDQKSYRISLLKSNWSLEWKLSTHHSAGFVFLAKSSNNSGQILYMKKSNWMSWEICRFHILGSGGLILYNVQSPSPSEYKSLISVGFKLPTDNKSCSLRRMQVKNGEVLNENNVPFFLPGSTVTIRCKPGFGFKALNYSSRRTVECVGNIRHSYSCSNIRIREERDGLENNVFRYKSYMLVIVLLSIFLIFSVALIIKGKFFKKD